MKSEVHAFGRIIKKYTVFTTNEIKDFNKKYEEKKKTLDSYGPKLAGRLNTELNYTNFLMNKKCYNKIAKCMGDYVKHWNRDFNIGFGKMHLEIISCWINDMVEGEWNPTHEHAPSTLSVVGYLKVPDSFVEDKIDGLLTWYDGRQALWTKSGYAVLPIEGKFYFFPGWLSHAVMPFYGEGLRRSMSANFDFTYRDYGPQQF